MTLVTIHDRGPRNVLSFDLVDILRTIGAGIEKSTWTVENLECYGDGADKLLELSRLATPISGVDLLELAANVDQVVDGEFRAFIGVMTAGDSPWLTIRAVDSSEFDVECERPDVIRKLRAHFRDVRTIEL